MRHSFAVYVYFEGMWQKMSLHYLCLLLLLLQSYNYRHGPLNVAPGMYSRKTVSNGLYVPAGHYTTFKPIATLSTKIHLVDQ